MCVTGHTNAYPAGEKESMEDTISKIIFARQSTLALSTSIETPTIMPPSTQTLLSLRKHQFYLCKIGTSMAKTSMIFFPILNNLCSSDWQMFHPCRNSRFKHRSCVTLWIKTIAVNKFTACDVIIQSCWGTFWNYYNMLKSCILMNFSH